jgi:UDP-N-acetylmuramoyl-L-alanyl-D-glutamate--2,6-diaminopimelate ligase
VTQGAPGARTLGGLLPDADLPAAARALPIASVTADSRVVTAGALFAALPGTKVDGGAFAAAAVAAGAVAVFGEHPPATPLGAAVFVEVADARATLAQVAARFYPRQPATIVAITGTNGKTSVAAFLRQIWQGLGHAAASLGTIGIVGPSGEEYSNLTTPDPLSLHRSLDRLAGEGVTHLALEASSHGLAQHRLDGLRLAAGAFTNLTRDHLDYHATVADYRAAKLRLFDSLLPAGAGAVVCADGDEAGAFVAAAKSRGLRLLTVGVRGADLRLVAAERDGFGQRLTIAHDGRTTILRLPLPGAFQAENALVAAGLAIATGGEPGAVLARLETIQGATGRLEKVAEHDGAMIVIDYAHTPDALANALDTLRPYAAGRLAVVFGAGGDRDAGKRPLMGAVARLRADRVIVTDDNPRSEDPALIRRQILAAVPDAVEIGDRQDAIAHAVAGLQAGDVLLIAGKGHERGQIIGDRTIPFSDHMAVEAALGESR